MQLRQEYTINNTTFKNELFISEKDNADIYAVIHHFFNCPITANNVKNICIIPANMNDTENTKENKEAACSEEKADIQENNSAVNVPVEHEEKETDVKVNADKKESDETDTPGFYLHLVLGENNIEKWGPWKSKKAAKQALYDMVYRRKKQTGYDVKYSVIDIIPMTEKEFKNRNK